MNSGPVLFLGLFASMAVSWGTFVLAPELQLGDLTPGKTVSLTNAPVDYPNNLPGMAHQGEEVYRANGCVYCHTEQVRPAGLGSDIALGWGSLKGDRYSVSRDYIFENTVMLGTQRIGPDLANAGTRMDAKAVLARLWDPRSLHQDSLMPSYRYLFDIRKIGRAPSTNALFVPPSPDVPPGYEVIPRAPALELAAYIANQHEDKFIFEVPPPPEPPSSTNALSTNAMSLSGTNTAPTGTNAAQK
jgi:cytochrome c oxidase cbb3-type subunit II